jgi:hypothetical protein
VRFVLVAHSIIISYYQGIKGIFPEAVDPAGAKPIGTLIVHPDGVEAKR